MKVIVKPQIQEHEAIQILRSTIEKGELLLMDTDTVKQRVLIEENRLILKEMSKEKNERFTSELNIDIYLQDGDYLIKTEKGYIKPIEPILEYTERLRKILK